MMTSCKNIVILGTDPIFAMFEGSLVLKLSNGRPVFSGALVKSPTGDTGVSQGGSPESSPGTFPEDDRLRSLAQKQVGPGDNQDLWKSAASGTFGAPFLFRDEFLEIPLKITAVFP